VGSRHVRLLPASISLASSKVKVIAGEGGDRVCGVAPCSVASTHLRVGAAALAAAVVAGCGAGSDSGTKTRATDAAVAKWAVGLRAWGSGMNTAINGISILFSRPASVRGIQSGNARVGRQLRNYERTLAACSTRVERLGEAPAALELARKEALHACISLEHAARAIRAGVAAFQRGLGPDALNATAEPLSAGEDGVRRAQLDLTPG
jgi:hypothetical protein